MSGSTRKVLKVGGTDRLGFLQGLVTNDVEKAKDGLVYAALLTPQGKYIADFFLLNDGDYILVDVAAAFAPLLSQRLTMYRLRADVSIEGTDRKVATGLGPAPAGAFPDPRHPEMGWRAYNGQRGQSGIDWQALRVAHCIPDSGAELTPDTYILEAGFERLNGVDFRKGCYVGQEIAARMKHKTELKKGLVTVEISGEAPFGTEITASAKVAGHLMSRSGDAAIAYLRHDRAKGELLAGNAQVTWDGSVPT